MEVTGEDLTVAFSAATPFHKKKAESPDNRAAVTAALRDVTGQRWRISYELQDGLVALDGHVPAARSEEEWLKRFIDEFDAEELPTDAEVGDEPGVGATEHVENGGNGAGSAVAGSTAAGPEAGSGGEAVIHDQKGA